MSSDTPTPKAPRKPRPSEIKARAEREAAKAAERAAADADSPGLDTPVPASVEAVNAEAVIRHAGATSPNPDPEATVPEKLPPVPASEIDPENVVQLYHDLGTVSAVANTLRRPSQVVSFILEQAGIDTTRGRPPFHDPEGHLTNPEWLLSKSTRALAAELGCSVGVISNARKAFGLSYKRAPRVVDPVQVSVNIEQADNDRIAALAKRRNESRPTIIRQAIIADLDDNEKAVSRVDPS